MRRLVGLGVVGVMVGFGIDRIFAVAIGLLAMPLVSFVVPVGIVDVFNRILQL